MLEGPVMPTTLFNEMDEPGLEDQRTLQLALKLSMLTLGGNTASSDGSSSPDGIVESGLTTLIASPEEPRTRKSQNMTECVPVPSSEHVAEIVGRQGCKIKALRAKTNTYIKTPVRGEEPVFVVTGRKEDVAAAKKEILSAADHFSQIRAQRKGGGSPTNNVGGMPPGPPHVPGQVTRPVRVPYKVVGLVVGPKGATIKRIQQQTHTYIVTPSRDREPVFEVTGLPDNVELAKKEIENHIAFRTGGLAEEDYSRPTPLINSFSLDSGYTPNDGSSSCSSSASSTGSSSFFDNIPGYYAPQKIGDFNNGYTCLFPDDAAHAIWSADVESTAAKNGWEYNNQYSSSRGMSTLLGTIRSGRYSPDGHPPARRFNSDPLGSGMITSSGSEHSPSTSTGSPSPPLAPTSAVNSKRNCMVCFDSPVIAALIPCGHNLFCMECAQRICKAEGACPVCQQPGHQAIRILQSQN